MLPQPLPQAQYQLENFPAMVLDMSYNGSVKPVTESGGDAVASGYGAKLKAEREGQGWTQAELARYSGVSLGAVRAYEQGDRQPTFESAVRLADALGVSVEEFAAAVRMPGRGRQ